MPKPKIIEQVHRLVVTRRVCPVCKKVFEGTGKRKFCSPACKMKDWYQRNKDEYNAKRQERYQAEKKTAGKK